MAGRGRKMRPLPFNLSPPETTPTPPPTEDPLGGGASSSSPSFDLVNDEFRRTILTHPIVCIKSKIHSFSHLLVSGEEPEAPEATHILREVLEPERTAIEAALLRVRSRRLSRIFSDYFEGSENTSRQCLLLHRSILSARSMYAPILDLLEALPSAAPTAASSPTAASPTRSRSSRHRAPRCFLSPSECDHALQIFLHFSSQENPLSNSANSLEILRRGLEGLAGQLNAWLRRDRRRRRAAAGAFVCLGVAAIAATVGAVVATAHPGPAAGAALALPLVRRTCDPLRRRRRREKRIQIEETMRGIFGLSKSLETFEWLARQLNDAVEDDRALINSWLKIGKEDRSFMAVLVRELRQTLQPLLKKLEDLESHVYVSLTFINNVRKLLFDHFHTPSSSSDRLPD